MKREYSQAEVDVTLQTLIEITNADTSISKRSRRSRRSQLGTFARVIGKPPSAIPASVESLRTAMADANPGPAGISHEYWGMVKSTVWWALEKAGVTVIRATGTELSDEWAAQVMRIPWRPHRLTLAPLLRFCSEQELSPAQFDQAASDRFRDWMRVGYRKRAWQKPYRRAVEMFAQCGTEFPETWPQVSLVVRFVDDHYTLGWAAFPELEVETDRMFAQMMEPPSRRSQTKKKPIRVTTARARKYYILRAASAIVRTNNLDPSSIRSLSQVVNPAAVETFVDFIVRRRNGADRTGDLSQACGAFNAIARHWLKLEKAVIEELVAIRRSVMPRQGPAEKNKRLMEDFRSPQMRLAFLKMPYRVVERLRRKELTDGDREAGELAFTTAFLTCAPLRIGEYAALEKGVHIVDRGSGKHRQVVAYIPGEVRKVDDPLSFRLSHRIIKLMDVHWMLFRRGANSGSSLHLLPGWKHVGRNSHHLSQQLAKFTARELGRRITAHQFRVLVGYIFWVLDGLSGCVQGC